MIDLRSDTVTKPCQSMRRAMTQAEVGDDVFGEDPTINRLQERAAELLGKEAALFVPSGTMANQINLRTLTRPGDEVICESYAHLYRYEGAAASLWGLSFLPVEGDLGRISAKSVAAAVQADNVHFPVSRVVALENTHNRGSGAVYSLQAIDEVAAVAKENGLAMHLDGARMFHACVSEGYSPKELASRFDTVSFCLSKGLGAPVGSMVVSTKERIKMALRYRKQLGGGMRQAGILAAAALYALDNNIDRLEEDHVRAKRLANGLAELKGVMINPDEVTTNIVVFDVSPSGMTTDEAVGALAAQGVKAIQFGPTQLRCVTHLDVNDDGIDQALRVMTKVLGNAG